jgi:hypothetical protein
MISRDIVNRREFLVTTEPTIHEYSNTSQILTSFINTSQALTFITFH